MTEVALYIAGSLDGFMATAEGSVDGLAAVAVEGEDYGYQAFFDSVDALVMGGRTYEQILEFGKRPYGNKPARVMTRRALKPMALSIRVTDEPVPSLLGGLGMKRVWLIGGAALIAAFE